MPSEGGLQQQISVKSLKHKNVVRAAESQNKAFPIDNAGYSAGNQFKSMLGRDNSVTHLPNVGLIA